MKFFARIFGFVLIGAICTCAFSLLRAASADNATSSSAISSSATSPSAPSAPQDNEAEDLTAAIAAARAEYEQDINDVAEWCRDRNEPELAKLTLAWIHRPHERLNYIYQLPKVRGITSSQVEEEPPAETSYDHHLFNGWKAGIMRARRGHAAVLFNLAGKAAEDGNASLTLALVNEALREDPESESARQFLGYKRHEGQWLTPYEISKAKAGQVWDSRFGWIDKDDLPRYEAGERRNRSLWVSAERDAQNHKSMDTGWRIETEHFSITTNHSLEAGAALGERLELLYQAWRQVFADYYLSSAQIKTSFERMQLPASRQKFRVNYFATEAEFRQALVQELPRNVKTTGVYLAQRRTSFFYHADPEDHATQYHEVTHQLFQEAAGRRPPEPGRDQNFWLVEGIACYMESLVQHPADHPMGQPYLTTGGVDAVRVQDARFYLFRQDFYEPLADVCTLGRLEFQGHPEIRKVYAQGGAVADMLMHADDGAYRQATMTLLKALYAGRRTTLPVQTKLSYADLDAKFRAYMNVADADLAACAAGEEVPYLALGGTDVTDAGLEQLSALQTVRWIDLAKTSVTDAGVRHLAKLPSLVELDLTATQITDAALQTLKAAPQLRKLVLTGTGVTDEAVNSLRAALPTLEIVR